MRTIPECQFGAAVALVQPESGTEMREEKININIHTVSGKCGGSCTWRGTGAGAVGLCPGSPGVSAALAQGSGVMPGVWG